MRKKIQDCLTSELLFEASSCNSEQEAYLAEYERRLKIMGLTQEQMKKFREADETAIKNGCYMKSKVLFVTETFIKSGMEIDSIKIENCTFSELVFLTDDANAAYTRDHGWLPPETWNLVCQHAISAGICKSGWECFNRMKHIGIKTEQYKVFIKNECKIIERLKWQYTTEFAWE